jgi:GNAT superfamily N-acetyltransferase
MQDGLEIRAAGQGDLPSLLQLYLQLNPRDPALEPERANAILEEFTRQTGSAIFVGFKDAALVTTCTLVVVPNLTRGGAPYALIENVVTDAGHRKRGYGQAILYAAIEAAWRCGCYKVMLLTGSKDPNTLSFYQGAGFEQTKTGFQIRRSPASDRVSPPPHCGVPG